MKVIIHRGTHEIGGSCIEVIAGSDSILLDLGMPLWAPKERRGRGVPEKTVHDLIAEKILPDIPGLYAGDDRPCRIKALVISHAHLDHYGLLRYVRKELPVYAGDACAQLMRLTALFTFQDIDTGRPLRTIRNNETFDAEPFRITPYLMDHSAFEAFGFLVKCAGKRLYYTGDFRSHGRKNEAFEWFCHNGPECVDALLMEGTMLGRSSETVRTEPQLGHDIARLCRSTKGLVLGWSSSQNIDRIVSFFKAALKSDRTLAVDIYTAHILKAIAGKTRVPYPSRKFARMKVFYPRVLSDKLAKRGLKEMLYEFKEFKVTKEEIAQSPEKYIVMIRPSLLQDILRMGGLTGACLIYSQWEGYKADPYVKRFIDSMKARNVPVESIHTSGHATTGALKRFAERVKPKMMVPVHTEHPGEYGKLFENVRIVGDGEEVLV